MKEMGRRILILWLILSAIFAACVVVLIVPDGPRALLRIMGRGDGTAHVFRLMVFAIGWLWVTGILLLSQFPAFTRRHLWFMAVLILLGFQYLNLVREPHAAGLGDFPVYYQAAVKVSRGEPIQGREQAQTSPGSELQPGQLYIYPPLLATVLSPFVGLTQEALADGFRVVNYLAVILLIVLLYRILPRYGYSREMAAVCILFLLAANVPLARTLSYLQVNVFVFDLMLLGLFFFPRRPFLSALCLSLAIHLKVYPVLLVIPFIAARQWRWLLWCVASQLLIVGTTSLMTDPRYYVDFVGQLSSLRETGLRNTSVSVFLYNTFRIAGLDAPALETVLSYGIRLALLAALTVAAVRIIRRGRLDVEPGAAGVVMGGYAFAPIGMLAASPSVWEHHYVLLILSVAVVATLLRTAAEAWTLLLSFVFIFLLPVVELYPFSYLPLLSVMLLVGLLCVAAYGSRGEGPEWFSSGLISMSPLQGEGERARD